MILHATNRRTVFSAACAALAVLLTSAAIAPTAPAVAQGERPESVEAAPDRPAGEGSGPYGRLIIRGATIIDGTGAPPIGPADIVIEGNRISEIRFVGAPGAPINPDRRPEAGDREIDAHGMYVLPGFINAHAHISNTAVFANGLAAPAEYAYKLWLAHGITTIRDVSAGNGLEWTLNERKRSAANAITAPRINVHLAFPGGMTADEARSWVRDLAKKGGDGIKLFGAPPDVMTAALDEAGKRGLRTSMHHAQMAVTRWNVLDSARAGLNSMEHWYGLPEALFGDQTVQNYPSDYNYLNEQDRFSEAGRLWAQAAPPWSDKWNAVMDELVALDFTIDPTFTIYEATRDLEAARTREWLGDYTWPALARFFQPGRESHGSFWYYWTTADEIAWKKNFRLWMTFVNEFKNRGGRVTLGDDAGYIYRLYGFGYVREFELLQEAGFHPLEVIRAATLNGAELIGRDADLGTIAKGKLADLVIIGENPLENFKVLTATGAVRLNDQTFKSEYVGGVVWTIKDGIVFDAKALLEDVKVMVEEQRTREAAEE